MMNQRILRATIGRTLAAMLTIAVMTVAAPLAAAQATAPPAGKPTDLDGILKTLATWDGGLESAAAWKLREYVTAHRGEASGRAECETKLIQFMRIPAATIPARAEAARQLKPIASDAAVAPLAAMLLDVKTADHALYVLRQIPGPVAGKALAQALATAPPTVKLAVIGALGDRREAAAITTLEPLLMSAGPVATSAATALGRIGGDAAVSALTVCLTKAPAAGLKPVVVSALMQAAEGYVAAKNLAAALKVYEPFAADQSLPAPIRRAAAMGKLAASGSGAAAALVVMLTSSDAVLQSAAVGRIEATITKDNVALLCDAYPKLLEGVQLQVLAWLGAYPTARTHQVAADAARSASEPVRLAALKTLESIGEASDVAMLVDLGAKARGAEQTAARATLAAMKGRAVDDAILSGLAQPGSGGGKGELMLAAGERRLFTARAAMVEALTSPNQPLRILALRGLRGVGTPSDAAAVIDVLLGSAEGTERTESERTLVALAMKQTAPDNRSRFVRDRLFTEKNADARARLIAVIGLIGDNAALTQLRGMLSDPDASVYDAVVRAFVGWPNVTAREDVFRLARDSRNETHRLLAIAGLVRLVGLDTNRDPQAAVADLRAAASFAWRPEEQRLVLGALPKFPCREAVDMTREFLKNPEVEAEVKAALGRFPARLVKEKDEK